MEPQPAIKFADAEKVPRVVLPVIRWQGRSIYLKQCRKFLQSSRQGALKNIRLRPDGEWVMARNRLQTLVRANVRLGAMSAHGLVLLPAPTSNGTRFPCLVSLLGPEDKSHTFWHRVSSLQRKGLSCQLCSGEAGC